MIINDLFCIKIFGSGTKTFRTRCQPLQKKLQGPLEPAGSTRNLFLRTWVLRTFLGDDLRDFGVRKITWRSSKIGRLSFALEMMRHYRSILLKSRKILGWQEEIDCSVNFAFPEKMKKQDEKKSRMGIFGVLSFLRSVMNLLLYTVKNAECATRTSRALSDLSGIWRILYARWYLSLILAFTSVLPREIWIILGKTDSGSDLR